MLRQGHPAPPELNWPFASESCTVARPTGREQRPRRVTPPAYAAAVIGYTTSRDAIGMRSPSCLWRDCCAQNLRPRTAVAHRERLGRGGPMTRPHTPNTALRTLLAEAGWT